MKQIEVTDRAAPARIINELRAYDMDSFIRAKENVANGMSVIAAILQDGRYDNGVNVHTDGLVKVMYTLSEYNSIVNALTEQGDGGGRYAYLG